MSATKQASSRRHRRRDDMIKLIEQQRENGQPVRVFCEKKGLSMSSFRYWKKRLEHQAVKKVVGFASVNVPVSMPGELFAECRGIKIFQPVSAGYLKELLA